MNRYRVVTHAHSSWSYDGSWQVADLAERLSFFGVHLLMMTEHSQRFDSGNMGLYRQECAAASNNKIRVLPGIEYSTPKNNIHILTWGIDEYLGEEVSVEAILDAVEACKGIAIFAHPSRRDAWKKFKATWARQLYGMEIWNRKTDNVARSPHACALIKEHRLRPVVSLDFHRKKQLYPLYNILKTKQDISRLTDKELVCLIRETTMAPRFLGLPADGSDGLLNRTTHCACLGLQKLHKVMFRSR